MDLVYIQAVQNTFFNCDDFILGELFIASITSFIGGVFLVISFISPYWLQSWEETQSPFKNMGLWEFCFYKFRHPDYQFDHLFHGCHALYGDEYRLIREKLMPGWLMVVQLFVSLTLILAILGLLVIVSLLLRCPLEWILRFEHPISMIVWGLNAFSGTPSCNFFVTKFLQMDFFYAAALLFFSVCIFGSQCWNRDWLLYPNYNFVSWSFAAALFACLFYIISAFILAKEVKAAKERKPTNKLMLMKLKPYLYNNGHSSYASTIRGSGYL